MDRRSIARLAVLACIWGASFLFIKVGLEGLNPAQIVFGRLAGGAVVLVAVSRARRLRLPSGWQVWRDLVVLAVIANVVPFTLFAWAEQRITSGMAGVLNGTTPLFTLVLALALLPDERATATRVAGLVTGFAGVVLIVGPWRPGALGGGLAGQLACLLAAALYGLTFAYTKRHLANRGHAPLALATGQLGAATGLQALVLPFAGRQTMHLDLGIVLAIAALGAMGTGAAYLLYYGLIEDVGATTASMVTYLIPVVAVALGVLVLDEPVTWNLFAGAAVVIGGVALAEGRLGRWGRWGSNPRTIGLKGRCSTS